MMQSSRYLAVLMILAVVTNVAHAETCTYTNAQTREAVSGSCTSGPAGVEITDQNTGGMKRIQIEVKKRQDRWANIEMNGKKGFRFEIDRCTFALTSEDFEEQLNFQGCQPNRTKDSMPNFMTPGGAWIGKWYSEGVSSCKTVVGSQDNGLISYKTDQFVGYEVQCQIMKSSPVAAGVELTERCSAEGASFLAKETLNVIDGKLKRTAKINGKTVTSTYSLCQ